jgi:hypothetical protein
MALGFKNMRLRSSSPSSSGGKPVGNDWTRPRATNARIEYFIFVFELDLRGWDWDRCLVKGKLWIMDSWPFL